MIPYLFILIAFLADRLSKLWAADYLATHGPTEVNTLFTLRETYNRGIAFGMFQGIGPLIGWLTIGVVLGMLVYLHHLRHENWLTRIGLGILIGGALGNLVDRVFVGEVLDFIETPLRPGVFNVADVMIYLGMILTFIGVFRQEKTAANPIPDIPSDA